LVASPFDRRGEGEGLFSRMAPVEFKNPRLNPFPLSKGLGEAKH